MLFIYQGRGVSDFSQLPPLGMRGIFLGESIFTSTRYEVGRPINFWRDHLQRLAVSAEQLLGVSGERWEEAQAALIANLAVLPQLLAETAGKNYYLRITGLATSHERTLWPSAPLDLEWLLAVQDLPLTGPGKLTLQLADDQRGSMPLKWGNYGPAILAGRQLQAPATDLLFINSNAGRKIAECSTSNFFAVFPGPEIWTAPVGRGVFDGIYRKNIIPALRAQGYLVMEKSFTMEELAAAGEEAFTTNCVQGICSVKAIIDPASGQQLNFGVKTLVTNQLMF